MNQTYDSNESQTRTCIKIKTLNPELDLTAIDILHVSWRDRERESKEGNFKLYKDSKIMHNAQACVFELLSDKRRSKPTTFLFV